MPDTFEQAGQEALQFLQGQTDQPAGSTDKVANPTNQQEVTPPAQQQAVGEVTPYNVPDDALIELEVGGEKVRKPWKQARAEMMLHADYTRKRQAEAEELRQAREVVEKVARRDSAYRELIKDPRNVLALYHALTGQQPEQPRGDELVTQEDILRAREEMKRETGQVVESAIQEFQDRVFVNDMTNLTNQTINAILKEKSEVAEFYGDDAAAIIKRMARAEKPGDADELKAALIKAGTTLHERVSKQLQERLKASAVKQTELQKKGIEPPGGAGIPAGQKTYGSGKNVNWGDIDRDAQAFLENRLK